MAGALVAAGIALAFFLANRIVEPLRQLTATTARIAGGDLDAKVETTSGDEVGVLAAEFNRMAASLRELRQSDMGQLVIAQQTTEAAIDSLYDPVIVTDAAGCVTELNPAAEKIFGTAAESTGRHIGDVARDTRIAGAVAEALSSQRPVAAEGAASVLPLAVDETRAARLLSNFLWSEGTPPPGGRLTLREIDRDELMWAERWKNDESDSRSSATR